MMNSQNPGTRTLLVNSREENIFIGETEPHHLLGPRRCGSQSSLSITNALSLVLLTATVYLILRGFWCMQELNLYRPLDGGNYARLLSNSRARWIVGCVEESNTRGVGARRSSTDSTFDVPILEAPAARFATAASQKVNKDHLYLKEAFSGGVANTLLNAPIEEAELRRQRKALNLSRKDLRNLQLSEIQLILTAKEGIQKMIGDKLQILTTMENLVEERKQLESFEAKLALKGGGNSSTELEETSRRIEALEKRMKKLRVSLRRIRNTMSAITQHRLQRVLSLKLFVNHRMQNRKISITAANALSIAVLVVKGAPVKNYVLRPEYTEEVLKVGEELLTSTQSATEDLLQLLYSPTNGLKAIQKRVAKYRLLQKDTSTYALQMRSALMAPSERRIIGKLEEQNLKLWKALEQAHGILQKGTTEGAARASQGNRSTREPFSLIRKILRAQRSTGPDKSR